MIPTDVSNALLILFAVTIFTFICESYVQQQDIERYRTYTHALLRACKELVIVITRIPLPEHLDATLCDHHYNNAIAIIDEINHDATAH